MYGLPSWGPNIHQNPQGIGFSVTKLPSRKILWHPALRKAMTPLVNPEKGVSDGQMLQNDFRHPQELHYVFPEVKLSKDHQYQQKGRYHDTTILLCRRIVKRDLFFEWDEQ